VDDFNFMPFEQAENELLYEEYEMLRDIYYALEHLNKDENYKITNYSIKTLATSSNEILKKYPEAVEKFDPFKSKLLNGLSKVMLITLQHFAWESLALDR
jgi:hypothetical protein